MSVVTPSRTPALAVACLLAAAWPAAAESQSLPPAERIMERYVEAIGGRAAFSAHQFRRTEAEMSMPAAGMTMEMEILQARPDLMWTRVVIPGVYSMTSGYDGEIGWSMDPDSGPRILEGDELQQLRTQAAFDAAIDFARQYPVMETVELTSMGGRPCYSVRMMNASGSESFNCFDRESGLLVGATAREEGPMGAVSVQVLFDDYRRFGGVLLPTRTVTSTMGQEMILTVRNVSYEPFERSLFQPPADVRALLP